MVVNYASISQVKSINGIRDALYFHMAQKLIQMGN